MRSNLACGISMVAFALTMVACKEPSGTNGSGGSAGEGGGATHTTSSGATGTTSGSGGATGAKGWTAMPLLDDDTDPENVIQHVGQDRVTSIYFASLEDGLVATAGENGTFTDGGLLYRAGHHALMEVALSGKHASGSGYEVDMNVIFPTKSGYAVGLSTSETAVLSSDGGQSFQVVEPNIPYGLAHELVLLQGTDDKWTYVASSGVVSEAATPPSPTTAWNELWAPQGLPPTPDPIPDGQCKIAPHPPNAPHSSQFVYVSPDRKFLAYSAPGESPFTICISHDGGKSFFPTFLPPPPPGAGTAGPTGITFITPQIGLAYTDYDIVSDALYIYRTTDGGETWQLASLPDAVVKTSSSIKHVFFAPDATHGFAVGGTDGGPLLLRTADAGATWEVAPGRASLAKAMDEMGAYRLYAGFALDASHLWVGGDHGALFANDAGGD